MNEGVLTSIISLIGVILSVFASSKVTLYRIEQLEKKVEKHNNLIERVYKIEEEIRIDCEKIKVINHRLKDLEVKE